MDGANVTFLAQCESIGRRPLGPAAVLAALTFVSAVSPLGAQTPDPVQVAGEATCVDCVIEMELVTRIGDRDGPGMVYEQAYIWMDAAGRFIVTAPENRGVIQVFDAEGRLIHSFGRRGEGPGEYMLPRVAAEIGDTIWIHDVGLGRLTLVDTGFRLLATRRTPLPTPFPHWVRLEDGSFVTASLDAMRMSGAFGQPLQRFSADGASLIGAFGSMGPTPRLGEPLGGLARTLAPSRGGGFWAAHDTRYRIERWNETLELVGVVDRDVAWFEAYASAPLAREEPPSPIIRGIQEDDTGLLWVTIGVADQAWRPMAPARVTDGEASTSTRQYNELYDTLIKVIDPQRGELIASRRIDPLVHRGFIGPGMIYTYAEDETGHPWYEIWRLSLRLTGDR